MIKKKHFSVFLLLNIAQILLKLFKKYFKGGAEIGNLLPYGNNVQ